MINATATNTTASIRMSFIAFLRLTVMRYAIDKTTETVRNAGCMKNMAKTAAAVRHFQEKGGLFISCLTNPTTGGVSASFASLGDIIIAEPKALICFAGPRVIRQTIGQELPEGFQRAEFLLEHGMIDAIVDKSDMRDVIIKILRMHEA